MFCHYIVTFSFLKLFTDLTEAETYTSMSASTTVM